MDPAALAQAAHDRGLALIAVTDHDSVEYVEGVAAACSAVGIRVIPGVEVTTSRGHLLCYAPSEHGVEQLRNFMARAGIRPDAEPNCDHVLDIIAEEACPTTGTAYARCLVTVAAHAEKPRSMLAGTDSSTSADQLARVARLDAVELTDVDLANQWASQGIKSRGLYKPLLVGSDAHSLDAVGGRHTWLYIHGDLSPSTLRQVLATDDVSLQRGGEQPAAPGFYLTRIRVEGDDGLHAGLDIELHPRINAIIGAPSVGKSLIVDILRQAFGDNSNISEVTATSRSRMAATLPAGSVITVDAVVDGEPQQFRREVGGAAAPTPSHRPIAFSQGELTRRAMAPQPDLELIDVHANDLESARERHAKACTEVAEKTLEAIRLAQEVKQHADTLGNTVDGLDAVGQKLEDLSPAQDVARRLQALQAARSWRGRTLAALTPSLDLTVEAPQVPPPPTAAEGQDDVLSEWVAEDKVAQLIAALRQELAALADEYKRKADSLLGPDPRLGSALQEAEDALDAELQGADGEPTEESSELLTRIKALQDRKVTLEELKLEKERLDQGLSRLLESLGNELDRQTHASAAVLEARKDACARVNQHIRGFYCRVTPDQHAARVSDLKSLRTGLREPTLLAYCRQLDPIGLVRDVVALILAGGADQSEEEADTAHARCIDKIVQDENWDCLSRLVTSRTDERLHIEKPTKGDAPVTFDQMTEGTRALAIKEISFAASDRPVVSDQPEDSVPTRAVFDELVPTLRTQRAARQFIVVSHDANIVVGSDADHVIALEKGSPLTGNLHEPAISRAALENLEGGEQAFERRKQRYRSWSVAGGDPTDDGNADTPIATETVPSAEQ